MGSKNPRMTGGKLLRVLSRCFLFLLMLCLSSVPVFADNSYIKFTNEAEKQPDLYVTKTVTCAVSGYEIPDAEFTFVLKWDLDKDGKLTYAKNEAYTVYTSDGTQVKNYDSYGSEVSFRTDSAGRFTLKAGWTARFEYVGTDVEYEITEINLGANWTQTTPASGLAATGTVEEEGTTVYFENTYVPTVNPPDDEDTVTELSVTKSTVDVDGNTYDTDQEFMFTLAIGGEAWANAFYTVYDLSGNEITTGTTGSDGSFVLGGNQKALFEDITLYEDYTITESHAEHWSCITDVTQEGGTAYPITYASYTNQLKGGYITLTKVDTNGEVLSGAVFGIYSDEACSKLVAVMTSGDDGVAISKELNPGTYYVREDTAPDGYALLTDIYEVEVHSEETASVNGGEVVNTNEGAAITILKVDSEDTDTVLEDAVFGIYSDKECETLIEEMTTDAFGCATSQKLDLGTYYVKEITPPDGYLPSETVYTVKLDGSSETVAAGEDGYITNEKESGSITLVKKDGSGKVLSGVTFELVSSDGKLVVEKTTDGTGTVVFDELPADTYTITETKTVSGQSLLAESITVELPLVMTQQEVDDQGNVDTTKAVKRDGEYWFYDLSYEVTNSAILDMPTSGGITPVYGFVGFAAVILAGISILISRRRKEII